MDHIQSQQHQTLMDKQLHKTTLDLTITTHQKRPRLQDQTQQPSTSTGTHTTQTHKDRKHEKQSERQKERQRQLDYYRTFSYFKCLTFNFSI